MELIIKTKALTLVIELKLNIFINELFSMTKAFNKMRQTNLSFISTWGTFKAAADTLGLTLPDAV